MNKLILVGLGAAAIYLLSGSASASSPVASPVAQPYQTEVVVPPEDLAKPGVSNTVAAINKRLVAIKDARIRTGQVNARDESGKIIHSGNTPMPASWSTPGRFNSGGGFVTVSDDGTVSYSVN